MKRIYFAGSITGGREDAALYEAIIRRLRDWGQVLTEHIGSEALTDRGEEDLSPDSIHNRDLAWMDRADVVIAEVTTPSLGVGYEIRYAVERRIPVMALFRPASGKKLSSMISGAPGVEVFYYEENDLDALFTALDLSLTHSPLAEETGQN